MEIRDIFTDHVDLCLDFFERYCISKGFSYVRVDHEIHFENFILFVRSFEWLRYELIEQWLDAHEKIDSLDQKVVSRRVPLVRESLMEIEINPFVPEKKAKHSPNFDFPYKENKHNLNTKGYPNRRIRKR